MLYYMGWLEMKNREIVRKRLDKFHSDVFVVSSLVGYLIAVNSINNYFIKPSHEIEVFSTEQDFAMQI